MFRWLANLFRRRTPPAPEAPPSPAEVWDEFPLVAWLPADQNPFGVRVLDVRPFTGSVLATTEDAAVAAKFNALRHATGSEHRGRPPADALAADCDLRYPLEGDAPPDGPLFVAEQMEDKWDVSYHDGYLYFARSWTGELIFRAAADFLDGEAVISRVEGSAARSYGEPGFAVQIVDFLMKSHVLGREVPHPLPASFPEDVRALALYSFGEYGRRARFGTRADTTTIRLPEEG